MTPTHLSSLASSFSSPPVRQTPCEHVTQGPATGPEGEGRLVSGGRSRPFSFLLADRKADPGSRSFLGCSATSSHTVAAPSDLRPHSVTLEAPTPGRLSSVSSEAGLRGLLRSWVSLHGLCLVIVQMRWHRQQDS